jgi:hypothetical protein
MISKFLLFLKLKCVRCEINLFFVRFSKTCLVKSQENLLKIVSKIFTFLVAIANAKNTQLGECSGANRLSCLPPAGFYYLFEATTPTPLILAC